MGKVVGIDLGTTYSAVAVLGPTGQPEIIPNAIGERTTPSVVRFMAGGDPQIGEAALRAATIAPLDVVQFIKRQMGNHDYRFDAPDGSRYTPDEISAMVLRKVKADAEANLREPVTDAVITVPAYFDDVRRKATMNAGRIAGLNVLRVINEPTAAALAFGLASRASGTFVVFDLGGGTFDVTVLKMSGGVFDVLGTDGLHELGGFDWDNRLMTWLNQEFQRQGGIDLMAEFDREAELREKVELAKRALSSSPVTRVALSARGVSKVVQVTREQFEKLTADLLNQARDLTQSLVSEVGLAWTGIDGVLLVGGSTRMPMVRHMLESISGRPIMRGGNPDELVALGAAIQAGIESARRQPAFSSGGGASQAAPVMAGGEQISVLDVTSHGLGTIALDSTMAVRNYVLIPRNSKIPAKHAELFNITTEGQDEIRVVVTEGDDDDPRYVRRLGRAEGNSFPVPPYPKGTPIKVSFAYDIDQTVFIEIAEATTGRTLGSFELDAADG